MARIQQMTFAQFEKMFPNEEACSAYLVGRRWPDGVRCPRCGHSEKVSAVSTMAFKWQCYSCSPDSGYRFSEITGTIFENTNKDLRDWFRVIHLMMTSKKGMSALQIQRMMGFGSYKTAHYMCMRIRVGMMDEDFQKLMGIVEVDETYVGGKFGNKHISERVKGAKGGRGKGKVPVAGAVERNGNVVARVVANASVQALHGFIEEAVSNKVSLICTDAWPAYDNRDHSSQENADYRFKKNGADLGASSEDDFIAKAHAFVEHPPEGAETLSRANGDTLVYDAKANVFAVVAKDGAPRTIFKPRDGVSYWAEQKANLDKPYAGSRRTARKSDGGGESDDGNG